jgi:hypothetical protein
MENNMPNTDFDFDTHSMEAECATCGKTWGAHNGIFCDDKRIKLFVLKDQSIECATCGKTWGEHLGGIYCNKERTKKFVLVNPNPNLIKACDIPVGRLGRYTLWDHKTKDKYGPYLMHSMTSYVLFWPGIVDFQGNKDNNPKACFHSYTMKQFSDSSLADGDGVSLSNQMVELLPVGTQVTFVMDPKGWK